MRVQLRLSNEARVILEEEKINLLKEDKLVTSGDIVSSIFKTFETKYKDIDWDSVRNNQTYDGILSDYTSINPTTLNLNEDTCRIIEEFRRFFNKQLNMKRTVYRSYIIRIVLKAYKLEQLGTIIIK